MWTMETRKLLRVIQLPAKIRSVKQLIFLPNNFDGGTSEVSDVCIVCECMSQCIVLVFMCSSMCVYVCLYSYSSVWLKSDILKSVRPLIVNFMFQIPRPHCNVSLPKIHHY